MIHASYEEVIFTWGKHKGSTLASVYRNDYSYIEWIAGMDKLPQPWVDAAKLVLRGEDISYISLPRAKAVQKIQSNKEQAVGPINVSLKDKKTAYIVMPYNKVLLDQFKYEIDGRKWNGDEKYWEFPAVHLPKLVKLFPQAVLSLPAKKLLMELQERREDLDEIRELDDTEFQIPGLNLPLFNYQKVGVKFIDRAGGRCLIADAPGLGKTSQSIAYAQLHNLKTLIVCPLSVVVNWQREIKKFTGKDSTIWDSKTNHAPNGDEIVGKIINWNDVKDFL